MFCYGCFVYVVTGKRAKLPDVKWCPPPINSYRWIKYTDGFKEKIVGKEREVFFRLIAAISNFYGNETVFRILWRFFKLYFLFYTKSVTLKVYR